MYHEFFILSKLFRFDLKFLFFYKFDVKFYSDFMRGNSTSKVSASSTTRITESIFAMVLDTSRHERNACVWETRGQLQRAQVLQRVLTKTSGRSQFTVGLLGA